MVIKKSRARHIEGASFAFKVKLRYTCSRMNKIYKDLKIEDIAPAKKKITATIMAEDLPNLMNKSLEDKAKHMVIPGFRKGEAPKELVAKQLGEDTLKQDAAKDLVAQAMAQIIIDEQLKVIGSPDIVIDEIKENEDITMTATIIVLPQIDINDEYKKELAKINATPLSKVVVSDEDVNNVITHLRREKARILTLEAMQKDKNLQMPDFSQIPEDKLPALEAKDFQELAQAKDLDEFKIKVKENIKSEKEFATKEQRRAEVAETLLKYVRIELPKELIEMELQRSYAQMEQDLQMMGINLETYLTQIQKNKDDFDKEMREAARKRAILQLALDKIAEQENIKPSPEEIQKEVEHVLEHNKQANPQEVAAYVDAQISNNKVFEFLEKIK